jgi:hypothetical protein
MAAVRLPGQSPLGRQTHLNHRAPYRDVCGRLLRTPHRALPSAHAPRSPPHPATVRRGRSRLAHRHPLPVWPFGLGPAGALRPTGRLGSHPRRTAIALALHRLRRQRTVGPRHLRPPPARHSEKSALTARPGRGRCDRSRRWARPLLRRTHGSARVDTQHDDLGLGTVT